MSADKAWYITPMLHSQSDLSWQQAVWAMVVDQQSVSKIRVTQDEERHKETR